MGRRNIYSRRRYLNLAIVVIFATSTQFDHYCSSKPVQHFRVTNDETLISNYSKYAVKSVQSEDGDVIDCIDIFKQPAFDHPALKNHKIQMEPTLSMGKEEPDLTREITTTTFQLWRRNGSCPLGTVPVRRILEPDLPMKKLSFNGRKKPMVFSHHPSFRKPSANAESSSSTYLHQNHSLSVLLTYGYSYLGAKAEIKVWNPYVEQDDEYSTSRITLTTGPYYHFESIESGWAVNPSVYGDRETRLHTYWTVDGSKTTGCFDLTCPGFVQTSNEVALGGVIKTIPIPGGLPWSMNIYIFKDVITNNWWVRYQDNINIGYWPSELFSAIQATAESVQWGGEVYSPRLGLGGPHTSTAMGNGQFPDHVSGMCGWTKGMRVVDNSLELKYPEWVYGYTDEYSCYRAFLNDEYVRDPEFYFGGPGRSPACP